MNENMREENELDRNDAPQTDAGGVEDIGEQIINDLLRGAAAPPPLLDTSSIQYIGDQPITGPLIGAEATTAPADDAEETPVDEQPATGEGDELNWYVVHCYSGYENKVKHNLEQRIEAMGVANLIDKVVVPTEEEMEVRDGKRRTVEKRVFPGYILVHMKLDERALNVVRATPGVTRFVGMGNRPTALTQQEVNHIMRRMEAEAPKLRVNFRNGQKVRITDGPFSDFMGMVDKIDTERAKVTVLVSFFGRETPVELDFLQVERM